MESQILTTGARSNLLKLEDLRGHLEKAQEQELSKLQIDIDALIQAFEKLQPAFSQEIEKVPLWLE